MDNTVLITAKASVRGFAKPLWYWMPCILLAAYPRHVYYRKVSMDLREHIRMCHRADGIKP